MKPVCQHSVSLQQHMKEISEDGEEDNMGVGDVKEYMEDRLFYRFPSPQTTGPRKH